MMRLAFGAENSQFSNIVSDLMNGQFSEESLERDSEAVLKAASQKGFGVVSMTKTQADALRGKK